MLFLIPLLFGASASAQRPENISICDYYTGKKYGKASKDNQYQLIQGIVSLAFAGSSSIENAPERITGILNPGVQEEEPVDLLPWFNGSKASSNLNNQPIGINWLDDGGVDPLLKFLTGETPNVVLSNTTNEYRLFGHFFIAFSRAFGCSEPPAPLPSTSGPVSLAYAHKFMSLNHTQLSYFIDQLTMSAEYWGFSEGDADTINQNLNSRYNVRCAPAVSFNPQSKPQLLSLCQHPTCPLAVPNADCNAYVNLTAEGVAGDSNTAPPSSTLTTATTNLLADLPTETPKDTDPAPAPTAAPAKDDDEALSTGGIAGVAVGGAAVLAIVLAAILWYKKRNKHTPPPSFQPNQPEQQQWNNENKSPAFAYAHSHAATDYHTSPGSPPSTPGYGLAMQQGGYGSMSNQGAHLSQQSYPNWQAPAQEMDSPRHIGSPAEMSGNEIEGR